MPIFAVTSQSGKEIKAADDIVDQGGSHIHSVVAPQSLNGYFFVEAESRDAVENVVSRITFTGKVLPGETSMSEVASFLEATSDVVDVAPGDTVRITKGAYEGGLARVTSVNESDESVTVELVDEPIAIPIELPGSQIRIENS